MSERTESKAEALVAFLRSLLVESGMNPDALLLGTAWEAEYYEV
jgi:hypothetical protein